MYYEITGKITNRQIYKGLFNDNLGEYDRTN